MTRIQIVKKINKGLDSLLNNNRYFFNIVEEIEDVDLRRQLLESIVVTAQQVHKLNTFIIAHLASYLRKDMSDKEFFKIMKQLEKRQ